MKFKDVPQRKIIQFESNGLVKRGLRDYDTFYDFNFPDDFSYPLLDLEVELIECCEKCESCHNNRFCDEMDEVFECLRIDYKTFSCSKWKEKK